MVWVSVHFPRRGALSLSLFLSLCVKTGEASRRRKRAPLREHGIFESVVRSSLRYKSLSLKPETGLSWRHREAWTPSLALAGQNLEQRLLGFGFRVYGVEGFIV